MAEQPNLVDRYLNVSVDWYVSWTEKARLGKILAMKAHQEVRGAKNIPPQGESSVSISLETGSILGLV